MQRQLTTILTIAGSDCSGGAGIQADLRAAAMRGVFTSTAVTAVTVQNSHGLSDMVVMPQHIVVGQIMAVFQDAIPSAIKIGMVGSLENGIAIARCLKEYAATIPIVIDPVMKASSGGNLSASIETMVDFYKEELCPMATVVTPNLDEAGIFGASGDSQSEQAIFLLDILNCKAVVLKGGHSDNDAITDVLAIRLEHNDTVTDTVTSPKIDCRNLHGTGCTFSSLMAADMAKGFSIKDAFRSASLTMKDIIAKSSGYSLGCSEYGPLNLFNYHTVQS